MSLEIFISYRRQDTSGYALGLRREFAKTLTSARVFLDVDSLEAGMRWRDEIRDRLDACDVMLVLIGDEWLVTRDGERKLHRENDPLRYELEYAFQRGGITIIPILLEDTKMPAIEQLPRPIARLSEIQAEAIHDRTYDGDVNRLIERLARIAELPVKPSKGTPTAPTPAEFPPRITRRYLEQEVGGMGRDRLLELIAELRRRGWTDEEIYDGALSYSPLRPPTRFPNRITTEWLASNVPLLSPKRIAQLTTLMRRRHWSSDDIRTHVLGHRDGGLAEDIPSSIRLGWLERNVPLMTVDEQNRLAEVMLKRGWSEEEIRGHVPYAELFD
jgi:hypothetical protein